MRLRTAVLYAVFVFLAALPQTAEAFDFSFSQMPEGSLPAGWATWGTDKTPGGPGEGLFTRGEGFKVMSLEGQEGNFAVSCGTVKEGTAVSAGLVTPLIEIPSEGALLRFTALNVNPGKTNTNKIAVYVSETGQDKSDFPTQALSVMRIAANNDVPQPLMVSLDRYAGKSVYVAIVNEGKEAGLLGIGSVETGLWFGSVKNLTPLLVEKPTELPLELVLSVQAPSDLLVVRIATDSGYDEIFTAPMDLSAGIVDMTVSFPGLPRLAAGSVTGYMVQVYPNLEGIEPLQLQSSVLCSSEAYPAMIVEEEATGEKCGYCPAGAAGLAHFSAEYPDRFIGLGVHCSAQFSTGVMESESYGDNLLHASGFSITSLPGAVYNRTLTCSPTDFVGSANLVAQLATTHSAVLGTINRVDYDPATNNVNVSFEVSTFMPMPGVQLDAAVALVADGLTGSNPKWYQYDYFSGTTKEQFVRNADESWWPWMQFYCEYPADKISPSDMSYDHVALGIWPRFEGTELEPCWEEGAASSHSISFTMPMQQEPNGFGVQDVQRTSVVLLVFNHNDGTIVGARKVGWSDYNRDLSGIDVMETAREVCKGVYTLDGRRLQSTDGIAPGLYIIDGKKKIIK